MKSDSSATLTRVGWITCRAGSPLNRRKFVVGAMPVVMDILPLQTSVALSWASAKATTIATMATPPNNHLNFHSSDVAEFMKPPSRQRRDIREKGSAKRVVRDHIQDPWNQGSLADLSDDIKPELCSPNAIERTGLRSSHRQRCPDGHTNITSGTWPAGNGTASSQKAVRQKLAQALNLSAEADPPPRRLH